MISELFYQCKKTLVILYLVITRCFFSFVFGINRIHHGTQVIFAKKRYKTVAIDQTNSSKLIDAKRKWYIRSEDNWKEYEYAVPERKLAISSTWYNLKHNSTAFWNYYKKNWFQDDIYSILHGGYILSIHCVGKDAARGKGFI